MDSWISRFTRPTKQEGEYDANPPESDLYDDVIAPSSSNNTTIVTKQEDDDDRLRNNNHHQEEGRDTDTSANASSLIKRISIYVGNLTWWTSDQDVIEAISSVGVTDVSDVKFYENRANGQSKGFCVVNLGSDNSFRTVIDKLPKVEIQGQNPVVTSCNRQSLNHFEMQSRKLTPGAPGSGGQASGASSLPSHGGPPGVLGNAPSGVMPINQGGMRSYGSSSSMHPPGQGQAPGMRPPLIGRGPRPNGAPLLGQPRMPPSNNYGQQQQGTWGGRGPSMNSGPRSGGPGMRPHLMPHPNHGGMSGPSRGGPLLRAPGPPPSSDYNQRRPDYPQHDSWMSDHPPHHSSSPGINSGYGGSQTSRSSSGPNNVHLNPAFIHGSSQGSDYGRGGYGDYRSDMSEAEAEEILSKNRTVCSGAISRAVGDAAAGEYYFF